MSALQASTPATGQDEVMAAVARLTGLLEREFEALKSRDLATLEQLQQEKNDLLEALAAAPELSPERITVALRDAIGACQQAHVRNAQLMQRQLDAVRGALQALQGQEALATVDLYDRMGQMSRRAGFLSNHLA